MAAPKSPVAPDAAAANETPPSFEQAVERLAEIVQKLERGDLPLEESLVLFESGVKLARSAQARLDHAERRVEELLGFDERGNPVVRELDEE
jgi:exodeoxyribonuclease VII small subunit